MVQKSYKDAYLQVRLCMHVDLSNGINTYTQEVLTMIQCLVIMHDGLCKAATSHLPSQ